MKFGQPSDPPDNYARLTAKLKKKLKQMKASLEHFGKIALIEVPFDLRSVDDDKLGGAVREAALNSRTALAIILANREANPHFRHHYSQSGTYNKTAAAIRPEVVELFDGIAKTEMAVDPILGCAYRRTWTEAQSRVKEFPHVSPD